MGDKRRERFYISPLNVRCSFHPRSWPRVDRGTGEAGAQRAKRAKVGLYCDLGVLDHSEPRDGWQLSETWTLRTAESCE